MRTLLDVFSRMERLGRREAVLWRDGYRTRKLSYAGLRRGAFAFAAELEGRSLGRRDRVLVWGENRPEWLMAFWGCLLRGVEVVPVDFRSSPRFVERILKLTGAKLALHGDETDPAVFGSVPALSLAEAGGLRSARAPRPVEPSPEDVVEIVFTSGATGEPKGVIHRHRNIAANLTPIAREIDRFARVARPFQPIRMLTLLPLSHMFGQATGLFVPALLGGSAAFSSDFSPAGVLDLLKRERISALVVVPAMLDNLKREIERTLAEPAGPARLSGVAGIVERLWRYRRLHARTGWKFWAVVVGGARLEPELEDFFRNLGYGVIQGYGLTETSPVVALNHPFESRRGSLGKVVEGQQVRLGADGEILVRGPSVATEFLAEAGAVSTPIEDGWLHTGDLGEMDEQGRLYYRGRKKDVIVRPDGLNVFPSDVEDVLRRHPSVEDCVVVGAHDRIHAALLLRSDDADPEAVVREANRCLETHQRIQAFSLWRPEELPRTPSTLKVRRGELVRMIEGSEKKPSGPSLLAAAVLGRTGAEVSPDALLAEDLGLTSLDRVDLLGRLEAELGVGIEEESFSKVATVADLDALVRQARSPGLRPDSAERSRSRRFLVEPRWNRGAPVRLARMALLETAILPMARELMRLQADGVERLGAIEPPVIFAANHASHLDTAAIFAALPFRWRHRLAPAMAQDYFAGLFDPGGRRLEERLLAALQYAAACALFNAYPLPRRMSGTRRALRYTGELLDAGCCPLVYPEGSRSPDGEIRPFEAGVGLMAKRLGAPVVPIRLSGTFEVYSLHDEWPRPGRVRVRVGQPLDLSAATDYASAAREVEKAIRALGA